MKLVTLRAKLVAGFAAMMVFMAVICIIGISRLNSMNDRLNDLVDLSVKKIELLSN